MTYQPLKSKTCYETAEGFAQQFIDKKLDEELCTNAVDQIVKTVVGDLEIWSSVNRDLSNYSKSYAFGNFRPKMNCIGMTERGAEYNLFAERFQKIEWLASSFWEDSQLGFNSPVVYEEYARECHIKTAKHIQKLFNQKVSENENFGSRISSKIEFRGYFTGDIDRSLCIKKVLCCLFVPIAGCFSVMFDESKKTDGEVILHINVK